MQPNIEAQIGVFIASVAGVVLLAVLLATSLKERASGKALLSLGTAIVACISLVGSTPYIYVLLNLIVSLTCLIGLVKTIRHGHAISAPTVTVMMLVMVASLTIMSTAKPLKIGLLNWAIATETATNSKSEEAHTSPSASERRESGANLQHEAMAVDKRLTLMEFQLSQFRAQNAINSNLFRSLAPVSFEGRMQPVEFRLAQMHELTILLSNRLHNLQPVLEKSAIITANAESVAQLSHNMELLDKRVADAEKRLRDWVFTYDVDRTTIQNSYDRINDIRQQMEVIQATIKRLAAPHSQPHSSRESPVQ